MRSSTTDQNVELTKTISVAEDSLTIRYRIDPTETGSGRVRLIETLSESVPRAAITFDNHDSGWWEYQNNMEMVFVDDIEGTSPVEATLEIESPTVDPQDCRLTVTLFCADSSHASRTDGGAGVETHLSAVPDNGTSAPAIGIIGTQENTGEVARTTLRAAERGLAVFIAADDANTTTARLCEKLGGTIVATQVGNRSDRELATELAHIAKEQSYPGILFHGECSEQLAFDASLLEFKRERGLITETVSKAAQTDVLVGVPAYNEAETVGSVVRGASEYADEVLVVDDGSQDETAERAREAEATVVEHDENRGYGHALKTIFTEADDRGVDSLVILDADGQHDAADIPKLVEKQTESDAEIVIGSRFGAETETDIPLYRRFGLWVITLLTNVSIGSVRRDSRIEDPQSGFRAYDRNAVSALADSGGTIDDRMSASIDILSVARDNGFATAEVPTTISYDVGNTSSQNPITHGMTIVNSLLQTLRQKRPVTVLGIPGIFLVLTGVGVGHWTVSNYISTGSFSLELTLVAALFVLTGTLSSFLSIVRHALNTE